jgi:hypothetical protein
MGAASNRLLVSTFCRELQIYMNYTRYDTLLYVTGHMNLNATILKRNDNVIQSPGQEELFWKDVHHIFLQTHY